MWFRRKKKRKDANSELSDTLVTLQSLLDQNEPAATDGTTAADSAAATPRAESKGDSVQAPEAGGDNIKNAVASDEHLEWDFKVDLAADEGPQKPGSSAFLKAVESEGRRATGVPETGTVVPIRRNTDENGSSDQAPPPDDDLPVLRNIMHLPTGDDTVGQAPGGRDNSEQFVEQCLKDIRKRLKRHEMSPLTAYQERQFRIALTSLKLQKDSGKFE